MIKTIEDLASLGPCKEGLDWAKTQPSLEAAWENCERGDWLWWLVRRIIKPKKEVSIKFANFCSERAKGYADAYAARAADAYAARAAARIAYAAADDAYAAADDAYAAYAAAAADAVAAFASQKEERLAQANFIRSIIPNPFSYSL